MAEELNMKLSEQEEKLINAICKKQEFILSNRQKKLNWLLIICSILVLVGGLLQLIAHLWEGGSYNGNGFMFGLFFLALAANGLRLAKQKQIIIKLYNKSRLSEQEEKLLNALCKQPKNILYNHLKKLNWLMIIWGLIFVVGSLLHLIACPWMGRSFCFVDGVWSGLLNVSGLWVSLFLIALGASGLELAKLNSIIIKLNKNR